MRKPNSKRSLGVAIGRLGSSDDERLGLPREMLDIRSKGQSNQ